MVAKLPVFPVVQPNSTTVGAGTTIGAGCVTTMVLVSSQFLAEVTTTVYPFTSEASNPLNNGESCGPKFKTVPVIEVPVSVYVYTGLSFTPGAGVNIVAVIVPSNPPLQVTGVVAKSKPVISVAACKVIAAKTSQPVVVSRTYTV